VLLVLPPQVSESGSVVVQKLMEVERYSHVMHISSTVTGQLQKGLDSWDALRAALPAGTVSGAPKVGDGLLRVVRCAGGCHQSAC
jgi:anthranilate/para-aminobenzoate synthase component I